MTLHVAHDDWWCECGLTFDFCSDLQEALKPKNVIDAAHLTRQREWSTLTFGPGERNQGIIDHIKKEFEELQDDPDEWIDVLILAFDGAWRAGLEPQEIIDKLIEKQTINESRDWPDWRTAEPGKAIEHVRQ